jgi:hypothetical protein
MQTISLWARAAAIGAVALSAAGCGNGSFAEINGSVEGIKINANSFFYGGPFIVFSDHPSECLDMSWVRRGSSFATGGEPPTDFDQNALLFTYAGDTVEEGNVSVEGGTVVTAHVVKVSGGALTVYEPVGGFIDVTEFTKQGNVVGNFELTFDNGDLSGNFEVEECNNLKADR